VQWKYTIIINVKFNLGNLENLNKNQGSDIKHANTFSTERYSLTGIVNCLNQDFHKIHKMD
jgi:hypothetical protein